MLHLVDSPAVYRTEPRPKPMRSQPRCQRILGEGRYCNEPAELEQIKGGHRYLCCECGVWLASGNPGSGIRVLELSE